MNHEQLAELHSPLAPLLATLTEWAGWQRGGLLLDIGCSSGLKSQLLTEAVATGGRVLGIDLDLAALHTARDTHPNPLLAWVAADAQQLPLRRAVADGAWCMATIGLLPQPLVALGELHAALRPGGVALVVSAERRWALTHAWPPALLVALQQALARAGEAHLPHSEHADDLAALLRAAGFHSVATRAFRSEPEPTSTMQAELPLLPWPSLRAHLAPYLAPHLLDTADQLAASPEDAELTSLLVAARGVA